MSLKKNIFYSIGLTGANYIFLFITFPYVTPLLGPAGIGLYNFVYNIVQFFMYFSVLGVLNLGTREIAKCNSRAQTNEVFSKVFLANVLVTAMVLAVYFPVIYLVPSFAAVRSYLLLGAIQIVFNSLAIEWLFSGQQNFKFITLRSVCVRGLYVLCVFLFVRKATDVKLYYILFVASAVCNGTLNWIYGRRFATLIRVSLKSIFHDYIKPMWLLGSYQLVSFFYVGLNTVVLGTVCSQDQVGYYSTAMKIVVLIQSVYTAYGAAVLPKISELVAAGDHENERRYLNLSMQTLSMLGVPCMIALLVYASPIIRLIAGEAFGPSVQLLMIASPLVLILGLGQVMITQVLIPHSLDRQVLSCTLTGAFTGIALNVLFVWLLHLEATGSMLTWVIAESVVATAAVIVASRHYHIAHILKTPLRYILWLAPSLVPLWAITHYVSNQWLSIAAGLSFLLVYCHIIYRYKLKPPQYLAAIERLTGIVTKIKN